MIGNKAILDTSIVIEVFNKNEAVLSSLDSFLSYDINTVTLGELYVGINRVTNKPKHVRLLTDFLSISSFMNIDETTASIYGGFMASLLKKGKPIPTNDVWIAATAKQHKLILFTKDKHFQEIEGIDVQYW